MREQRSALRRAWQADLSMDASLEVRTLPNANGEPLRVFLISADNPARLRPAIIHFHSGGFILGTPEQFVSNLAAIARATGALIVSVDYPLAPEHPFPAALMDGFRALDWLRSHADELGVDRDRVGLMGDSAGGGLAAGLALFLRDEGHPQVAFLNLMYPMLDDRTAKLIKAPAFNGAFVWDLHSNAFAWQAYLGGINGDTAPSAYAAPSRAADLADLPPTYIAVGSLDLFLDEDVAFAQRLTHAGVAVELQTYPGCFHGFDLIPVAGIAQRAREDRIRALRSALGSDVTA